MFSPDNNVSGFNDKVKLLEVSKKVELADRAAQTESTGSIEIIRTYKGQY